MRPPDPAGDRVADAGEEQARIVTSKFVAEAAFERSKGKILPLSSREDLTVLINVPDEAGEIDAAPPQPTPPLWRAEPRGYSGLMSPMPRTSRAQTAKPRDASVS